MQKTIVLVDGSSYIFRAYHALPPLTTKNNEPCGALYGISNMLKKLKSSYPDTLVCLIYDAKGKNFRHELYPEYKANRSATPEDLLPQFEPIHQLTKAMGFPLICVPGVEADDVIGTLTKQAEANNYQVIISTGDKDIAQLVSEKTTLVNTMTDQVLDINGVIEKFGVPPERMIDYLSLMGDKSDNIPGIPKVGPKTAVKWLNEYGSLDGVVESAAQVKGKVGESLREHLSQLPLAKDLVTIRCDLTIAEDVADLQMNTPDIETLKQLYQRFEFKTALNELSDQFQQAKRVARYDLIQTEQALDTFLRALDKADCFTFDLETTSLDVLAAEIVGISLSIESASAVYIPVAHTGDANLQQLSLTSVLEKLKPYLQHAEKVKIAHNLKYDYSVLMNYALEVQGPCFDTMLASYVVNSTANRHDLDTLADKYLMLTTTSYEEVTGSRSKQISFAEVDIHTAKDYACEDADICFRLYEYFLPKVEACNSLSYVLKDVEMPLVPVLAKMERQGVLLDSNLLAVQGEGLATDLERIEADIYSEVGHEFNIDSPKQLQEVLYLEKQLPILAKTPKGQPSTAESVLSDLAVSHELPKQILLYRSLAKLKSTYVDKLPQMVCEQSGRIHAAFHQAVTATGRLSSSNPNLQNIPIRRAEGRAVRQAFVVPPHYKMVALDYSQIELRIMAHLSEDPILLRSFAENLDVHSITASEVFGVELDAVTPEHRRQAKAINFGLIYGMSAFGLAKQLGVPRDDATAYIERYFDRYAGVKRYMERTKEDARNKGYVETLSGRRLYLPEINTSQFNRRQAAERTAINAPMQGTAADIIKLAMININDWLQNNAPEVKLLIQVHDELVFEMPESMMSQMLGELSRLMSGAFKLRVPLIVSAGTGTNWQEAH